MISILYTHIHRRGYLLSQSITNLYVKGGAWSVITPNISMYYICTSWNNRSLRPLNFTNPPFAAAAAPPSKSCIVIPPSTFFYSVLHIYIIKTDAYIHTMLHNILHLSKPNLDQFLSWRPFKGTHPPNL